MPVEEGAGYVMPLPSQHFPVCGDYALSTRLAGRGPSTLFPLLAYNQPVAGLSHVAQEPCGLLILVSPVCRLC